MHNMLVCNYKRLEPSQSFTASAKPRAETTHISTPNPTPPPLPTSISAQKTKKIGLKAAYSLKTKRNPDEEVPF